jgi:hypothetical protein
MINYKEKRAKNGAKVVFRADGRGRK